MDKCAKETLGRYLQKESEARRISLEDVAKATRFGIPCIRAATIMPATCKKIPFHKRVGGIIIWLTAAVMLTWLLLYGLLFAVHANNIDAKGNHLNPRHLEVQ